jgi:hypothetical protein
VTKNNRNGNHRIVNKRNGYVNEMMVSYRGWYQYLNNSNAGEALGRLLSHDKCGGPADGGSNTGDCRQSKVSEGASHGGRTGMAVTTKGAVTSRGAAACCRCQARLFAPGPADPKAANGDEWHD